MNPEQEAPRDDEGAASARLRESLPDVVGLVGFGLLARGLWVGYGEAVSLAVCGVILMALSAYAIIRGDS